MFYNFNEFNKLSNTLLRSGWGRTPSPLYGLTPYGLTHIAIFYSEPNFVPTWKPITFISLSYHVNRPYFITYLFPEWSRYIHNHDTLYQKARKKQQTPKKQIFLSHKQKSVAMATKNGGHVNNAHRSALWESRDSTTFSNVFIYIVRPHPVYAFTPTHPWHGVRPYSKMKNICKKKSFAVIETRLSPKDT